MYYVYVLKSRSTGKHYTGYTKNLSRRLRQHNTGQSKATRWRGPFDVLYVEEFSSRSAAMRREAYFKQGKGREELQIRILQG
ncbi:MAG: GIY-YIG nuclease family protein [Candidatus Neomarinimicrobiota bacterium]